jgi:cytochrome P450
VELNETLSVPLPLVVICDMHGLPRSELGQFKRWSDGIAQLGGLVSEQELIEIRRGFVEINHYLAERVEERRRDPRDDIMTDLPLATERRVTPGGRQFRSDFRVDRHSDGCA